MEKLRLIRPSWRDWRKSQLTHYPTTPKPLYQFQPNSKKLNAKVLPLCINSQASGWSTGRPQGVKSIMCHRVAESTANFLLDSPIAFLHLLLKSKFLKKNCCPKKFLLTIRVVVVHTGSSIERIKNLISWKIEKNIFNLLFQG